MSTGVVALTFRVLAMAIGLSGVASSTTNPAPRSDPPAPPARAAIVVGHRGQGRANALEPENDVAGLVRALDAGASAVEFDVQLSRDGEVVLAHDERLDRTSDGHGCVATRDARELGALHLRDGGGHVHPEHRMATLREALTAIRPFRGGGDAPFVADIHIKVFDTFHGDLPSVLGCPTTDFRALSDRVAATVREFGMEDVVLVSSFDERVLARLRDSAPSLRVALISYLSTRLAVARASAARFDAVVASDRFLSEDDIAAAHREGLRLFVWFPHDESSTSDAFSLARADGVISDHPQAIAPARGWRRPVGTGAL